MDLGAYLDDFNGRDWQTATEGTVRFAMIGLGWWTTDWAIPATADSEFCETTVAVSGSAGKAERVASKHGLERALTYEQFHDGESADAYDAVYVATPNAYHLPYVETAAELGKAVLCEKPMEATVERAERLVDCCERHDVPLMVAYRMQTEPVVRQAREFVRDGVVGEPVFALGNHSQRLLEMIPDENQWRLNRDLTGYGTSLMDLGIYSLNTTRFLLDADPTAVYATMRSEHNAFGDVPDERTAFTCEFENGVQLACTTSQNAHGDSALELVGTRGKLRFEPAFSTECDLTVERESATVDVSIEQVDEMLEEFDYFADRVLTSEPIHADGEHGLVDMRALAALYESGDAGERVKLDCV